MRTLGKNRIDLQAKMAIYHKNIRVSKGIRIDVTLHIMRRMTKNPVILENIIVKNQGEFHMNVG